MHCRITFLKSRFFLTFLLFGVAACLYADPVEFPWKWQLQDSAKVSDGGEKISQAGYVPSGWNAAVVPGTVLTSLVRDGVYPEPMYGENNRSIPESLCHTSYWYRTKISIPSTFKDRHIWINFEGICYNAEVWVNGNDVGDIKGAFTRGHFDVTRFVTAGGIAGLAVKILPPPHPSVPHEHTLALGTGRNGGAMGADGPAMLATVGWDWIPAIRDRDMGIWQTVSLTSTGPVVLRDPYVSTNLALPKAGKAELKVQLDLTNVSGLEQQGRIEGNVRGTSLRFSEPVSLEAGEKKTVTLPMLTMSHPKLWWPNGFGEPHLYQLEMRFTQAHGRPTSISTSFGVRTIEYFRPGQANMTLIVNGIPVFAKGGNWGMDDAMKRIPYSRLEDLMRLHHDANLTMIRNWIGMSTEEDFYDLCDKYGIMVWDDFWLANPVDGPIPLDNDLFLANAREKIVRYRNHPSIAVWCGRNEGFPPKPISDGLAQLIHDLDGKRFYQPHSSDTNGVGGGGPYSYRKSSDYFTFRDSLHTEIGAPSIPTLESIEAMMPKKDWWPINDDWAEHDFLRGAQRGDQFPAVIGARFGAVTGLSDFVRKGHLATYESYRAMFEGRESRLFDPATGLFLWMSNPSQPSFVWQLYAYDLEQTAAFFGVQHACEPVHIELDPRDGRVLVVNNRATPLQGLTAKATLYNIEGHVIRTQMGTGNTEASSVKAFFALSDYDPMAKVFFAELALTDTMGHEVSRNFYWLGTDCTEMSGMPVSKLNVQAKKLKGEGGDSVYSVTLVNPGHSMAIMAHLQMRKPNGDRVLPCAYTDNFISLGPMESRTIQVRAQKDLIGPRQPYFALDGWNVEASGQSAKGEIPVLTNSH